MARLSANAAKRGTLITIAGIEPSLVEMRIILTVFEFAGVDDQRDIF